MCSIVAMNIAKICICARSLSSTDSDKLPNGISAQTSGVKDSDKMTQHYGELTSALGKTPIFLVRRRISLFKRYSKLLVRMRLQCSSGY